MQVKRPPNATTNPFALIAEKCPEKLNDYLEFFSPTDKKGRYLHYDQLKFRVPTELDTLIAWSIVKHARTRQRSQLITMGEPSVDCYFVLTPLIQKAISDTDRNATTASLEWISSQIGERAQLEYLLNDLIEDESISSSQLEGAATTTLAAKELLQRNRKPKTTDEKMILGNFKMMKCAWENRDNPLTLDLVRELHNIGVEGINDDHYTPGVFRKNDKVHVADFDGNILHTPPPSATLNTRMKAIINWINQDHSNVSDNAYLHPLIKAIILHFAIGYEHPFNDGNGRVARALFYWYLFHNDFAAFRYISISVLLKKAPVKYGKSYLYTETDDMDLTYFIEYQCGIVIRAIEKFKEAYQNSAIESEKFNQWLWKSGLYKKLNDKQRTVFQVAKSGTAIAFTARMVEKNLGCSYNTASTVLNGLFKLKLFKRTKTGREWVYYMEDKDKIIKTWNKG